MHVVGRQKSVDVDKALACQERDKDDAEVQLSSIETRRQSARASRKSDVGIESERCIDTSWVFV